jgi:hypothetical protein
VSAQSEEGKIDVHVSEVVVRKSPEKGCSIHDSNNVEGHIFSNAKFECVALDEEVGYVYARDHECIF